MTWEAGCAGTVSERRDSSNPVDDIEVTVTAFGGSLNYDPIDQSNARMRSPIGPPPLNMAVRPTPDRRIPLRRFNGWSEWRITII